MTTERERETEYLWRQPGTRTLAERERDPVCRAAERIVNRARLHGTECKLPWWVYALIALVIVAACSIR